MTFILSVILRLTQIEGRYNGRRFLFIDEIDRELGGMDNLESMLKDNNNKWHSIKNIQDNAGINTQKDMLAFLEKISLTEPIDINKIDESLKDLDKIVEKIEKEQNKPYNLQWQAPQQPPNKTTCDPCEFRFSCENVEVRKKYHLNHL